LKIRRILYAVTSPVTASTFLVGHLADLRAAGYELQLLSADDPPGLLETAGHSAGVHTRAVPFEREISPIADLRAFARLVRTLRQFRPDIVNAGTPKAGLLTGLAAWFCRVPVRVYTLHGLRLETARGLKWLVLWFAERAACACAHHVVCVSPSLRTRAIDLHLLGPGKALVLANGSVDGIDADYFRRADDATLAALRATLQIPKQAPVVGFVGRMTRDKGLPELLQAMVRVRAVHPDALLLLVGAEEPGDPLPPSSRDFLKEAYVRHTGHVTDPAPYYSLMSCLALPSHREGLGHVALEASCAGIPVVATDIPGLRDAIVQGVSGILLRSHGVEPLAGAILDLLADPARAEGMGVAGRERVRTYFNPARVRAEWRSFYASLKR